MLQVCEQDMAAADGALAKLRGERVLAGKGERGGELAGQPVGHSLWEQGLLEAYNEVLFGHLEGEVRALRRRKADYGEARRLTDGGDSCWSNSDDDSDNETILELAIGPPTLEVAVVVAAQGRGWWKRGWVLCSLEAGHQQCLGGGYRE